MLPPSFWPSSVFTGWGTWTMSKAPMAMKKVTTSMVMIQTRPFAFSKARIMPASRGARMPGPESINDISPLARPYCSFETMVLMAAE